MPLSSRVRVMLSSQMLWPASCSAWVRFMAFCLPSGALRITPGRGSFPAPAGQLVLGRLDHMAGLEAEFGLDLLDGRRGPEGLHAEDCAVCSGVPVPAVGGALL